MQIAYTWRWRGEISFYQISFVIIFGYLSSSCLSLALSAAPLLCQTQDLEAQLLSTWKIKLACQFEFLLRIQVFTWHECSWEKDSILIHQITKVLSLACHGDWQKRVNLNHGFYLTTDTM